ncbi:hypothetical protein HHI36_010087 [Cryptolaemus montrouzieri]|uniref:Uncharacterized protein n=1 Tax=Cryptolaemus montrouzieri TaxID=559131 RepID=A0ABD2MHR7_9CUCU
MTEKINMSTLPRPSQEGRAFAIQPGMLALVDLEDPQNCSSNGRHRACVFDEEPFGWKCRKRSCQKRRRSLFSGSFFSEARITIQQIIYLMYSFAWDDTYQRAIHKNPLNSLTAEKQLQSHGKIQVPKKLGVQVWKCRWMKARLGIGNTTGATYPP